MGNLSDLDIDFDVPAGSFDNEPLQKGFYDVEVIEAELKDSRKGGKYIKITLREEESGKLIWDQFNVIVIGDDQKKAAKAESIGRGQWSACWRALGITAPPKATSAVIGKKARAQLDIEEYLGKQKNTVKKYQAIAVVVEKPAAKSQVEDDDNIPF